MPPPPGLSHVNAVQDSMPNTVLGTDAGEGVLPDVPRPLRGQMMDMVYDMVDEELRRADRWREDDMLAAIEKLAEECLEEWADIGIIEVEDGWICDISGAEDDRSSHPTDPPHRTTSPPRSFSTASPEYNDSDEPEMKSGRALDLDEAARAGESAYLDKDKSTQEHAQHPEATRGRTQTQANAEHYNELADDSAPIQERMNFRENDHELAPFPEDTKKNGMEAARHKDEELLPEETPLTLQEAAKDGAPKAEREIIARKKPLDTQDHKGIAALGRAIGANRITVVTLLLDNRANPYAARL